MKADNATYWHNTYQSEVNARDEFFGDLLALLPGAEDEGMDAYDQIPRGIKALRAERDALKAELAAIKRVTEPPTDGSHDLPDDPAAAREQWDFMNASRLWHHHMAEQFRRERDTARVELAEARAAIDGIRDALETARRIVACSGRDWSRHADDVRLYALLVGWDCEMPEHADGTHDEIDCSGPNHLEDFAERFGWTEGRTAKLRAQRCALAALDASHRPEDTAEPPTDWHVFDDGAGGIWSHPHSRADCTLPECHPAPESPEDTREETDR